MKRILELILVLFCVGCINQNKEVENSNDDLNSININVKNEKPVESQNAVKVDLNSAFGEEVINYDNLADTMYFLPLQTTDESLFNGIKKISIGNDRIIIRDYQDNLLIFDINGNFISKLRIGNGPGELFNLLDFTYDKINEKILVYQSSDYINIYDKDGTFIEDKKMPLYFWEFSSIKNRYLFLQPKFINQHIGDCAKYSAFVMDNDFKVLFKGINVNMYEGYIGSLFSIIENNEEIIFSLPGNDTIYGINDSSFYAKYILDFNDYEIAKNSQDEILNSSNYYHSAGFFENSKTQIFHFYSSQKNSYTIIRDKQTQKMLGGVYGISDPYIVPSFFNIVFLYNDYFVSYFNPLEEMQNFSNKAISEEDKQKVVNLTSDDNAVLVFFKFNNLQ